MSIFKPKEVDTRELNAEVRARLDSERKFWDECVLCSINEDDNADATFRRSVDVADRLLAARRERFPFA